MEVKTKLLGFFRDRDGFRDRLDARRNHGTGRNLQRRTLYASLPDNSIRSRRFQLQPNQCGPGCTRIT